MPKFWSKVINIGINQKVGFKKTKEIRLLNLYCIIGIPVCIYFLYQNLQSKIYFLALIDLALIFAAVGYLIMIARNSNSNFARLFFLLISSVTITVSSLYYNNESEILLIFNIILSYLVFYNRKVIYLLVFFNGLQYLMVKYWRHLNKNPFETLFIPSNDNYIVSHQFPVIRVLIISFLALFLIILSIQYFKNSYELHLHEINEKSIQLKLQQEILLLNKTELESKNNQLENLNRTKEKLFSIVAHDIKSPISSLKGLLELFNRNYITASELQKMLTKLNSQVNNLESSLDNLLQWSLSQLNGIQVSPSTFNLHDAIVNIVEMHSVGLKSKQVEVKIDCAKELLICADKNHVYHILTNLLSNALKFSYSNSSVLISCYNQEQSIVIEVKDFGKGMSEATVAKIFNPLEFVSTRGTQNEKGTGVGLILCKEFIDKNNGRIEVTSTLNEGSVFRVYFPHIK